MIESQKIIKPTKKKKKILTAMAFSFEYVIEPEVHKTEEDPQEQNTVEGAKRPKP